MGITHFQRSLSHSHTISISQSLVCIYLKTDSICYDVRFIRKQQRKSEKNNNNNDNTRTSIDNHTTIVDLVLAISFAFHSMSNPKIVYRIFMRLPMDNLRKCTNSVESSEPRKSKWNMCSKQRKRKNEVEVLELMAKRRTFLKHVPLRRLRNDLCSRRQIDKHN